MDALPGELADTNSFFGFGLVYGLGPEPGVLSLDSEWLVLQLGARGTIAERRVVSD